RYVFKLPDLGEGTVDAEIVSWRVKPGDTVAEDDPLVEVMTEKATVEVPAPVSGRIVSVRGEPGEKVPVGSELAVFETEAKDRAGGTAAAPSAATSASAAAAPGGSSPETTSSNRVLTSPAIRRLAREAGVDLGSIEGSGPNGRILRSDLESH